MASATLAGWTLARLLLLLPPLRLRGCCCCCWLPLARNEPLSLPLALLLPRLLQAAAPRLRLLLAEVERMAGSQLLLQALTHAAQRWAGTVEVGAAREPLLLLRPTLELLPLLGRWGLRAGRWALLLVAALLLQGRTAAMGRPRARPFHWPPLLLVALTARRAQQA